LSIVHQNGEPDLKAFWSRADGYFPESRPAEWIVQQAKSLQPPPEDTDPALAEVVFGDLMVWRPGMVGLHG
jgi:hypothetical protein